MMAAGALWMIRHGWLVHGWLSWKTQSAFVRLQPPPPPSSWASDLAKPRTRWSFSSNWANLSFESGLVRMSATLSALETNPIRTKWKSISMCFVLAWKTGFAAKYVAPILSQYRMGVGSIWMPSSFSSDSIHMILDVAFAKDLYSASMLDQAWLTCAWLTESRLSFSVSAYISRRDCSLGVGDGFEWVSSEGVEFSTWESDELVAESFGWLWSLVVLTSFWAWEDCCCETFTSFCVGFFVVGINGLGYAPRFPDVVSIPFWEVDWVVGDNIFCWKGKTSSLKITCHKIKIFPESMEKHLYPKFIALYPRKTQCLDRTVSLLWEYGRSWGSIGIQRFGKFHS